MAKPPITPDVTESETKKGPDRQPSPSANKNRKKKHISMHEGIGAWADCCSCEAEPYWRELADEMGVDFNEYEEDEFEPVDPEQESGKNQ